MPLDRMLARTRDVSSSSKRLFWAAVVVLFIAVWSTVSQLLEGSYDMWSIAYWIVLPFLAVGWQRSRRRFRILSLIDGKEVSIEYRSDQREELEEFLDKLERARLEAISDRFRKLSGKVEPDEVAAQLRGLRNAGLVDNAGLIQVREAVRRSPEGSRSIGFGREPE